MLDLDATDDPMHGHQLGRFFHGYYGDYCYLPLYIFCGEHLLCARLRPVGHRRLGRVRSKQLERIVAQLRRRWPEVKIVIRADSGLLPRGVHELVRAQRRRLRVRAGQEHASGQAHSQGAEQGPPASSSGRGRRRGCSPSCSYRTLESWSRKRRVVAKAEHLAKGANPRFVVTSLTAEDRAAKPLVRVSHFSRR